HFHFAAGRRCDRRGGMTALRDNAAARFGGGAPRKLRPARRRHPMDRPAGERNQSRDRQVRREAADRGGLPANKGTERDPEKQRAVVPRQNGRAVVAKVVGEATLLSGKERLRDGRGEPEGKVDHHSLVEREAQQQKTCAETGKAEPACPLRSEKICRAAADQYSDDRSASVECNH